MKISDFKKQIWQGEAWDQSISHLQDRPNDAIRKNIFAAAEANLAPIKKRRFSFFMKTTFASLAVSCALAFLLVHNFTPQQEINVSLSEISSYVAANPELTADIIAEYETDSLNALTITDEIIQANKDLILLNLDIEYYYSSI